MKSPESELAKLLRQIDPLYLPKIYSLVRENNKIKNSHAYEMLINQGKLGEKASIISLQLALLILLVIALTTGRGLCKSDTTVNIFGAYVSCFFFFYLTGYAFYHIFLAKGIKGQFLKKLIWNLGQLDSETITQLHVQEMNKFLSRKPSFDHEGFTDLIVFADELAKIPLVELTNRFYPIVKKVFHRLEFSLDYIEGLMQNHPSVYPMSKNPIACVNRLYQLYQSMQTKYTFIIEKAILQRSV